MKKRLNQNLASRGIAKHGRVKLSWARRGVAMPGKAARGSAWQGRARLRHAGLGYAEDGHAARLVEFSMGRALPTFSQRRNDQ